MITISAAGEPEAIIFKFMTINEITEKCSKLEVSEERAVQDDYYEVVFCNKVLEQWNKALTDILGEAVKPAGQKVAVDHLMLTKDFGGIYQNQTLFKKDFEDSSLIAMFWPWQDNIHTTLKVALIKK